MTSRDRLEGGWGEHWLGFLNKADIKSIASLK
jgi:hypothetical protein